MAGDDHLGDALPGNNLEGLVRQIHQNHADFAAIIRVDGAGRVQHGDAVLGGKTASGPHLRFESRRKGDVQPRGNHGALQRGQG